MKVLLRTWTFTEWSDWRRLVSHFETRIKSINCWFDDFCGISIKGCTKI